MPQPRRVQASGRRRRKTLTGTELSRDAYVDAAVNLIENRGAGVLSVRTLAAAVGADASALYRHFAGIDDVLLAAADRMIGLGLDRWSPGADWTSSLAGLARVLFSVYVHDFPRTGHAVASRTTGLANEIRAVELTLGLLRDGGFDEESAVKWFVALSDFMLGQAMLESAVATLPVEIRTADEASWREVATRLPCEGSPHTQAAAPHLGSYMRQSSFDLSLELILAGLAASPRTRDR